MNSTFLERLNNKQLTNIDQYRKLQKAISETATEDAVADSEEWKNWNLAPVSSGAFSASEQQETPIGSEHLVRALGKIDK